MWGIHCGMHESPWTILCKRLCIVMLSLKCSIKYWWLYKVPSYIIQLYSRDWPEGKQTLNFKFLNWRGLSKIMGRHPSSVCKNVVQGNVWYLLEKKFWNVEELQIPCGRDILSRSWKSELLKREFFDKMCYRVFSSNHSFYLPSCQDKTNILFLFYTKSLRANLAKLPSIDAF